MTLGVLQVMSDAFYQVAPNCHYTVKHSDELDAAVVLARVLLASPAADSLIADLARQFCTIDHQLLNDRDPEPGLAIHSLALRHDLALLCGVPCECSDGSCGGLILGGGK